MRLKYEDINERALNLLLSVKKHTGSIGNNLKCLVELRVSQINGCAYCVDLHASEVRNLGESQQRIDCLSVWKESGLYSSKEMAAFEWAESVTNIFSFSNRDKQLARLRNYFSDEEIVDLTIIVALMNSLNRLAISCGDKPESKNI